ncbi:MAG: hypothetical protein KDI74_11545 [Gammaproteobacteria bacterium]|nr:hypothetical protein [Gammaproteobacteria bacterium]HXK57619.1 hypothetical protein [Gammaproteobacteria bacterium]
MGLVFKILAFVIYFVAGIWGFLLSLGIVVDHLGPVLGAVAFILAPVTLVFAPWYEAVANSDWFLVMLVYGGGIGATMLYFFGSVLDED